MIAYIIIFILFLLAAQFRFVYFAHMFQLNAYHYDMHLNWLNKNYLRNLTVVAPKKAKKPFTFTARMKRLCATFNVLTLAVFAAAFFTNLIIFMAIILVYYMLIPYIMLLCNMANRPIEKAINRHYINDARRILAELPNLKIIGIAGSYGKTSVKHFLTELLSVKYETAMTPGNYNTTWGAVRTIRTVLKPTHEMFVCEMGHRRRGDLKEICDLVKPEVGILNTIGYEHLDTQGTIENIIATNFELIESLPQHGIGFINYDSHYIRDNEKNYHAPKNMVRYGIEEQREYYARSLRYSNEGTVFTVVAGDEVQEFKTDILGEHNVLNITAAIACAHKLGISLPELVPAVKRLKGVPHRLQLIKRGNLSIIDDAYNSNLIGAQSALKTLGGFRGFKVLITPGMIELGDMEAELNFEFGVSAAAVCDLVILIGKEQTKDIYRGLFSVNYPIENVVIQDNFNDGFAIVEAIAEKQQTVVLIENDLPDNY